MSVILGPVQDHGMKRLSKGLPLSNVNPSGYHNARLHFLLLVGEHFPSVQYKLYNFMYYFLANLTVSGLYNFYSTMMNLLFLIGSYKQTVYFDHISLTCLYFK